ncbi:unnamed protein product, partial [Meganyctiphanes norvegica]
MNQAALSNFSTIVPLIHHVTILAHQIVSLNNSAFLKVPIISPSIKNYGPFYLDEVETSNSQNVKDLKTDTIDVELKENSNMNSYHMELVKLPDKKELKTDSNIVVEICDHGKCNYTVEFINKTAFEKKNLESIDNNSVSDYSMSVIMSLLYITIFFCGMIGNFITCTVITSNRKMHTATNYYLFNLAISDVLLLVTGIPNELGELWHRTPYLFGEAICVIRGLAAEMSANASILTISAFTVERYIGICHSLGSAVRAPAQLKRAVRIITFSWIIAFIFALPQSMQYGIIFSDDNPNTPECSIAHKFPYAFELSTFLFFFTPMSLLLILYIRIILKLKNTSKLIRRISNCSIYSVTSEGHNRNRSIIKMLVAVVVAFFICWAPFHAQRLLAIYGDDTNESTVNIYNILTHVSGVFYYLSTCVNPILYHIMSHRFRKAFKSTVKSCCRSQRKDGTAFY